MIYKEPDIAYKKHLLSYSKPMDICKSLSESDASASQLTKNGFITSYKQTIYDRVNKYGLTLRLATEDDAERADCLIQTRFQNNLKRTATNAYDLIRFIKFGHGLILENSEHKIVGCLFEEPYNESEKISISRRLAIDSSLTGMGMGGTITLFSCLIAMERGALVKTGLIKIRNYLSHLIHLNNLGWILDSFYPNSDELGVFFSISMPLNPAALLENRIDLNKLQTFIAEKKNGVDYCLTKCDDFDGITKMYDNNDFKIVAISALEEGEVPEFFALPSEVLRYSM